MNAFLYGKGYIEDTLCGVDFRISGKSFYQTNPVMTEILYSKAMEAANLTEDDVVFDAYSGIGTIGLIAATKNVKKALSVELVKEAVVDGKENAKRNGIENFYMYCADASSFMSKMAEEGRKVDVLFMDPPRKGSDEKFLKAVLSLKPSRIVYVSCDPSTLARDIASLKHAYDLVSVQPVDMFPMTTHVETVASLILRNTYCRSICSCTNQSIQNRTNPSILNPSHIPITRSSQPLDLFFFSPRPQPIHKKTCPNTYLPSHLPYIPI